MLTPLEQKVTRCPDFRGGVLISGGGGGAGDMVFGTGSVLSIEVSSLQREGRRDRRKRADPPLSLPLHY